MQIFAHFGFVFAKIINENMKNRGEGERGIGSERESEREREKGGE